MEQETVVDQKPNTEPARPVHVATEPEPPRKTASLLGLSIVVLVGALVIGFIVVIGITRRAKADTELQRNTDVASVPTVAVQEAKLIGGAQEVVIPGNMQAFIDTPIWARASGYLKTWYVDIGAHVKAGQMLGLIESPETDQQAQQAREALTTAQANLKLAELTAERYNNLFKTDSVAKQDVDNAVQDLAAKKATVSGAEANVKRLEQLVRYEKIDAPFDGVITARNVDVGALVDAGANTPGRELFHLASTSTLRVYVNVPEVYDQAAKPGVQASLTLTEFPGRSFFGKIVRNAESIDQASRTLLVEVDVKNPSGELLPGSYVSVHLKLPAKVQAVTVPVSSLLFRKDGLQIARVQNNKAELVSVIMGRDFGDSVELLSGVKPKDLVIVNPSDSIYAGQPLHVTKQGA
ncbi:MAG: efflux RND transporter periplasmic adaptor subunit [Rhodospirillales bacterium]|nr:efflux RND transporter periplasmic adaptor subunit [Acetobacter sp.]